jgi:hypothetical protein
MQKTNISKEVHGQANAPALRNLGISFHHGIGVAQDRKKAFELYKQASELGDSEAMCRLAEAYWHARGTRKNYQKAYQWFLVANPDVSRHWSVCPELFEYFEYHLTKTQIREAKIWVGNWKPIAEA